MEHLASFFSSLSTGDIFKIVERAAKHVKAEMEKVPVPFSEYYQNQEKEGLQAWKSPVKFRGMFHALYSQHVNEVVKVFFTKEKYKVLELGAGFLKENHKSQLLGCIQESYNFQITYSDINPKIVVAALGMPSRADYIQLDARQISKKIDKSSLDGVMASCFLDTLHGTHLPTALKEIFQSLKEGGLFFHISDLDPYVNTLVIDHKDNPGILFPLVEDNNFIRGLQVVPREDCERKISSLLSLKNEEEAAFLQKYLDLSNDVRAASIIQLCTCSEVPFKISEWIKTTFPQNRKEIINEKYFQERVQGALKETGFEILQCGLRIKKEETPRGEYDDKDFNDFASFHGHLIKQKKELAPGMVRKALSVHIIVAKKIHQ